MTVLLAAASGTTGPEGTAFLTPLGEHTLLVFWVQLAVLLVVARTLGGLMRRIGQPAVVGELGAGLLLGPSILGRLAPGITDWLFPGGPVESALLLAVAWIGIFLLLIVTGFEMDLRLLKRLGRSAANVSVGSLVVPLGVGVALGLVMPSFLLGDPEGRLGFALFMGVALSISALPVVAKILTDMGLVRRDFGQITMAAGMANDLIGWILLGGVVGIVTAGTFDLAALMTTLGAVVAFIVAAMTLGQRGADWALRRARGRTDSFSGALGATVVIALCFGALTQWIGVEAVLGALVAGIVVGRSKYHRHDVQETLESMSGSVFAPIFFATAGLYVDFAVVLQDGAWVWALVVIGVAAATKLVGSWVGARMSGLSSMEGLAIGIGLNARGALEIVVATIGFSLGALNDQSYAIVVIMAMVTSMAAPPLLRPVLRRLSAAPEETARLEMEELLKDAVVVGATNVLLPTRGGENSRIAARLLDLTLQPASRVTVLTVATPGGEGDVRRRVVDDDVVPALRGHRVEQRQLVHADPTAAVLREAGLGYDLLAVGLNDDFAGSHQLSPALQRLIASTPIPLLLVRRSRQVVSGGPFAIPRRIVVPVTGTRIGRAAEEVAYVLGARLGAQVDAVHVVAEGRPSSFIPVAAPGAAGQLERSRQLSERFGGTARVAARSGPAEHEELVRAAREHAADVVVIGALARVGDEGVPFLGYGAEHVLEHADATVIAVIFPAGD